MISLAAFLLMYWWIVPSGGEQEYVCCLAKAGMAVATNIAAITKAAVTTNIMRLIGTALPVEGRRKEGVRPPPLLASPLSVREAGASSHPPYRLSLGLLGSCYE